MRPVSVRLSAAGFSPWIPLNRLQNNFNVGLAVVFSSNGNLTCTVQHTFDNIFEWLPTRVTRSTTTATARRTNHGLSTADWIGIQGMQSTNLDGFFAVASIPDQDTVTYTVSNTGATEANGFMTIGRLFPHLTLQALTADADGNYISPVTACRLLVSAYTAGYVDLIVSQGLGT